MHGNCFINQSYYLGDKLASKNVTLINNSTFKTTSTYSGKLLLNIFKLKTQINRQCLVQTILWKIYVEQTIVRLVRLPLVLLLCCAVPIAFFGVATLIRMGRLEQ